MSDEFSIVMSYNEAETCIKNADISEDDKKNYLTFINNFSKLPFFRNTEFGLNETELDVGVKFPENLRNYRKILADTLYGCDMEMKFKSFIRSSPRKDDLHNLWYSIGLIGISLYGDTGNILLRSSPGFSLIPIATVAGLPMADSLFLGVNASGSDSKIYEFNILDIFDTHSEGESILQSAYEVFDSYPQMLAHISEIKYKIGNKEIIVKAGQT